MRLINGKSSRERGDSDRSEQVRVMTLLTLSREEAREVFATFTWKEDDDPKKIGTILDKFGAYCQPRKNIPFKQYQFNR